MLAWKVLDGVSSCHGGTAKWYKPYGKNRPGKWMPKIARIKPCTRGYHVCDTVEDLLAWLGPDIWVCEWRGDSTSAGDKRVVEQARLVRHVDTWNERTARLFAVDCAEDVLHLWEERYPNDDRPRKAIEAARALAEGTMGVKEVKSAANAADNAAANANSVAILYDDVTSAAAADAARTAAYSSYRYDDYARAARNAARNAVSSVAYAGQRAHIRAKLLERLDSIIGPLA